MAIAFKDKAGKVTKGKTAPVPKGKAGPKKPLKAAAGKNKGKEPQTALALIPDDKEMVAAFSKLGTVDEFMQAGLMILRRTVDAVMHFAELISTAKDKLTAEEFGTLTDQLKVAQSTARQYIVTAKSPRLAELRKSGADLPSSGHSLYLIASMDDATWKAFQKEHGVTRETTTAAIRAFLHDQSEKDKVSNLPRTTKDASVEAAKTSAAAATAPAGDEGEAFTGPEDNEGAEGSPAGINAAQAASESREYPSHDREATARQIDVFRETAESLLALFPQDVAGSVTIDDKPEEMTSLAIRLQEHVDLIRGALADREFELTGR